MRVGLSRSLGVVSGLIAIAGIAGGATAFSEEPPAPRWKPAVGKWYRWEDPNKDKWDAVDIATSQGNAKVTFLSRVAPIAKLEHFEAILFSEGAKVMPLPYSSGGRVKIDVYSLDSGTNEGSLLRLSGYPDRPRRVPCRLNQEIDGIHCAREERTFLRDLQKGDGDAMKFGWSAAGSGKTLEVYAYGGRAREVTGTLSAEKGRKWVRSARNEDPSIHVYRNSAFARWGSSDCWQWRSSISA